jgi:hypothetical protein
MRELKPLDVVKKFAGEHFPQASVVILGGSVIHGDATPTSDLDIVIVDETADTPFRKTFHAYGWKIEAFVLTMATFCDLFAYSYDNAVPTLQRICAQGVVIVDRGAAGKLRETAREQLERGPLAWTEEETEAARYEISECLDDLEGSANHPENVYTVCKLAMLVPAFVLRTGGRWVGDGKWMLRSLKQYDAALSREWTDALDGFYRMGEKHRLIRFIDRVLLPYGGRLSEGFTQFSAVPSEDTMD